MAITADAAGLPELLDGVLRRHGVDGWSVRPGDFWCRVDPPGAELRDQGWKLHVSAAARCRGQRGAAPHRPGSDPGRASALGG